MEVIVNIYRCMCDSAQHHLGYVVTIAIKQ